MKKDAVIVAGLETAATVETVATATNPNFSNREFLENNEPEFDEASRSKKYDAEREPKVQEGLIAIRALLGDKINPLIILLAKWWEVKPARAEIKKMIDAEAASKNVPEDIYLQTNLRKNVDTLAGIQNAVDRMRYSITYFKPRAGVKSKELFKQFNLNGKIFNVSLTQLEKAREDFKDDRDAMVAYLIGVSVEVVLNDVL